MFMTLCDQRAHVVSHLAGAGQLRLCPLAHPQPVHGGAVGAPHAPIPLAPPEQPRRRPARRERRARALLLRLRQRHRCRRRGTQRGTARRRPPLLLLREAGGADLPLLVLLAPQLGRASLVLPPRRAAAQPVLRRQRGGVCAEEHERIYGVPEGRAAEARDSGRWQVLLVVCDNDNK